MTIAIPEATLIVTLTALGLQTLSNIVIRKMVDLKKEKRLRTEVAAFDKELREAISKKDKEKDNNKDNVIPPNFVPPQQPSTNVAPGSAGLPRSVRDIPAGNPTSRQPFTNEESACVR